MGCGPSAPKEPNDTTHFPANGGQSSAPAKTPDSFSKGSVGTSNNDNSFVDVVSTGGTSSRQSKNSSSSSATARLPQLKEAEDGTVPQYNVKEIKTATNNYRHELGRGGFGPVYKGAMVDPRTGQPVEVAIKLLDSKTSQGPEEFMTEVLTMGRLQHPHVLKLLGCCRDGQRALIYELIRHGDVEAYLVKARRGEVRFSLAARMRIMMGCADALSEIHAKGYIHRDFKPSNVLLKDGLVPVVADFGLAHTMDDFVTHMSTRVMGTRFYLDPVYFEFGHLSPACDVYAFGIFMLELLTGIPASESAFMPFRTYIVAPDNELVTHMTDDDVLDANLKGQLTRDELFEFIDLIRRTQSDQWEERPTMDDIYELLSAYVKERGFEQPPVQEWVPDMSM